MNCGKTPAAILIVDDHPMLRYGLARRISEEPDLSVCGEAEDVDEALRMAGELSPDLVIIDIALKTSHGIDLIKQLRQREQPLKMLAHSTYDEFVYAERALQAGALGYVNKQAPQATVIDAIRTVLAGKTYLSSEMTDHIVKSRVGGMVRSGASPVESLSDRELEVFMLIGQGQTTGAIVSQLHLSVHTIDTYREKLKTKLNLPNSAELNRYAVQWVLESG